jgi:dTDP-4-dehydrorhamnose reductase
MKKILVIGAKGMAGHVMYNYFSNISTYIVYGIARNTNNDSQIFNIDVSDTKKVQNIINEYQFDYVINCIGILNNYAEENPDKAIWYNSYFPHFIEGVLKNTQSKLIHISTDCVFSGKKGGYTENDIRDGTGFYAQSKALGEVVNNKDVTIRTSIIGPELKTNGIGLLNWFLKQSKEATLSGFSNAFWTGLTTFELAKVIHEIIIQDINGLIQVTPKDKISKYELLKLFNSIYRNNSLTILEENKYVVDKSLVSLRKDFIYSVPNYKQMLMDQMEWIKNHQDFYKHYSL